MLAANYAVPSAQVGAVARPAAGGQRGQRDGQPVAPGDVWGDRVNEIDLRVAKILRFGRTRTNVGLDLYNVFNSSAVLNYNQTFVPDGSWLQADAGADVAVREDQRDGGLLVSRE